MRTLHRVSVHSASVYPCHVKWAAGLPSMIRIDQDIHRGAEYPTERVHEVIRALKTKFPEMIITVY